jgi:CIC family chloride channel protein
VRSRVISEATRIPRVLSSQRLRRFLDSQREAMPTLLQALIVGALAGFVGGAFRRIVDLVTSGRSRLGHVPDPSGSLVWLVPTVLSAAMLLVAVFLVRRGAPEAAGSGVQEIEGALDGVRPLRWRRVLPVKFIGGVLSLGAGLVLGREGPTIQMGGNLGRMVHDGLRRTDEEAHVLTASGAGAGLAAAFNAPLAGVLFVLEEMRPQFRYNVVSVLAVLVACATSDAVVRLMLGDLRAIEMVRAQTPVSLALWMFLVFGAVVGVVGVAFNAAVMATLALFDRMGVSVYIAALVVIGGTAGFLDWYYPDAVGGGYRVVSDALSATYAPSILLALFAFRFLATILCFATGAPGGIFAPMVALGTVLGMAFGHGAHAWFPGLISDPAVFAVAGMGAMFAATVRAPVTAIILTVEMTGSYGQTLPLMAACAAAVVIAHVLGGLPIYSMLLERRLDADHAAAQKLVEEPTPVAG